MTSKTSGHRMTTTQWSHMEKDICEYADLKEKNEVVGKLIQKSQSEQSDARKGQKIEQKKQVELRKGQAECVALIETSKAKIETSQKVQAKAKIELVKVEKNNIFIQEATAKIKETNANTLIESKTSLTRIQTALKRMAGSEVLLEKTATLITQTESLGKINAEDTDVNKEVIVLQASIKELALGVQALVKSNAAAKK